MSIDPEGYRLMELSLESAVAERDALIARLKQAERERDKLIEWVAGSAASEMFWEEVSLADPHGQNSRWVAVSVDGDEHRADTPEAAIRKAADIDDESEGSNP